EAVEEVPLAVIPGRVLPGDELFRAVAAGHDLEGDDVSRAAIREGAEVIGEAEALAILLSRKGEVAERTVVVGGVEHHYGVTLPARREVAVDGPRAKPALGARLQGVAPEARLELLAQQPLPLLALQVLGAP